MNKTISTTNNNPIKMNPKKPEQIRAGRAEHLFVRAYIFNVQASPALSIHFETKVIKMEPVKLKKLKLQPLDNVPTLSFILRHVFTKDECTQLIAISEENGYEQALLNMGGKYEILAPEVRNSSRTIIDDVEFANLLSSRISSFVPQTFANFKAVGVNERLRFLRYDPGEKFAAHFDGSYEREGTTQVSKITLQIYLNDGFQGGATTFLGSKKNLPVQPQMGSILVFEFKHGIRHEGSEVTAGRKYTIRTDVMYEPE